jgi:hypothetical protein
MLKAVALAECDGRNRNRRKNFDPAILVQHAERKRRGRRIEEVTTVGQDRIQFTGGHSEPRSQLGKVSVRRCRGQLTTTPDIRRAAQSEAGVFAIDFAPFDRTAHEKMIPAPTVVGADTITLQRPPKVRCREEHHLVLHSDLDQAIPKGIEHGIQLREQLELTIENFVVVIPAATMNEKRLPPNPQHGVSRKRPDEGFHLSTEIGLGKHRLDLPGGDRRVINLRRIFRPFALSGIALQEQVFVIPLEDRLCRQSRHRIVHQVERRVPIKSGDKGKGLIPHLKRIHPPKGNIHRDFVARVEGVQ